MTQDLGVGSHIAVLAAAVARTTGPVIECGTGWWSTPLLHLLCKGRRLLSCETDKEWLSQVQSMESEWHQFKRVEKWADVSQIDTVDWAVAFVDGAPGEERIDIIRRLKARTTYIVAHDTCADRPGSGGNYGWKQLEGLFKYEVIYKGVRPWTTVYSDHKEFEL